MDKDFDFDNIGKRTPYRTPDNFFEETQRKILERTVGEQRKKRPAFFQLHQSVRVR